MKRNTRKILSVLTALTCLTSAASMTALAVENDTYSNSDSSEGVVSLPYNPNSSNTTLTSAAVSSILNDSEKISTVTAISGVTVSTTAVQTDTDFAADNSEFGELEAMISEFIEDSDLAARTFIDEEFFDGVIVEIQEYWNQDEICRQILNFIAENNIDESKVEFIVLETGMPEVPTGTLKDIKMINEMLSGFITESGLAARTFVDEAFFDGVVVEVQEYWNEDEITEPIKEYITSNFIDETKVEFIVLESGAIEVPTGLITDISIIQEMLSGFITESGLSARTFVNEAFSDGVVVEVQEYWNEDEITEPIKEYITSNFIDETKVEFIVLESSSTELPDNFDTTEEERAVIEQLICEYLGNSDLEIGNIYKSYALDGLYNENYYDAESFESLICGEVRTYAEVGEQLLTLLEKDGELKVVGETLQVGKNVVELNAEADKINSELDSIISETKFCNFPMLRLAVIYYKDLDGAEFVRPYIENPYGDYTGIIENGKLYSAKEFLNQMKLVFDISDYDSDANIGIPDTYIIGDANGDYSVDVRDCSYIAKMLSANLKGMLGDTCDYNKDGVVNVRDAASMAMFIAKK